MASDSCDGCGRTLSVAGGLENLWTFENVESTGLLLEFEDGSEHLLCYPCMESLPQNPVASDVEAIESFESDADGE